MKQLNNVIDFYGDKLDKGELETDTTEVYSKLLSLETEIEDVEFKYKDTLRMLTSFIENKDYDWNNCYHNDILRDAKQLSEED